MMGRGIRANVIDLVRVVRTTARALYTPLHLATCPVLDLASDLGLDRGQKMRTSCSMYPASSGFESRMESDERGSLSFVVHTLSMYIVVVTMSRSLRDFWGF